MFNSSKQKNVEENYKLMLQQVRLFFEDESDLIANLSNASSLLNFFLEDINWVGFYLLKDGELVLGPFQGLPACVRIKVGSGVCGTAAQEQKTILVDNVHEFPGHIACDGNSNSEIVVPIIKNNQIFAVLDIDSPSLNRFNNIDKKYLELFVNVIEEYI